MKVLRIDHLHIKIDDMKSAKVAYEAMFGITFPIELDTTSEHGTKVAFNPFPNGIELMQVTDAAKELGSLYAAAPVGVFAVSLKVPNIDEATVEMEAMDNKLLMRYDFGPIKEALFDSKKNCGVYVELIEFPGDDITALSGEASAGLDVTMAGH